MSKILVVSGSARPASVNSKVTPYVVEMVKNKGAEVVVADLAAINLPMFDAPTAPSAPDFVSTHENVRNWTQMVAEADGVVFVTPEYNHTMSPIQMNAIDWIGKEWEDKPIALVGYGWTSGAGQAHATAREALAVNLKARVGDDQANLFFTKELNMDGTIADQAAIDEKVNAAIDELLANC